MWNLERTIYCQFKVTCERRRISGRRFSRYFSGGEKRRPEIHLHSQAKFTERCYVVKDRYTSVKLELSYVSCSFQYTFLLSFCAEFLSFQWRCPVFSACFVRFLIIFLTPRQTCKKYVHCIVLKLFYVRFTFITRQLSITAFSNRNLCLCECL